MSTTTEEEPRTRKIVSEETRARIGEKVREAAQRRRKKQAQLESELEQLQKEREAKDRKELAVKIARHREHPEPLKIGNYYVYDVEFENTRRYLILPVTWAEAFKFEKGQVSEKEWFGEAQVADIWKLRIGAAYNFRIGGKAGVYQLTMSSWFVQEKIDPLIEKGLLTPEDYDMILDGIDKYQSMELFYRLVDSERQRITYRARLEARESSTTEIAEEMAADAVNAFLRAFIATMQQVEEEGAVEPTWWDAHGRTVIIFGAIILIIIGLYFLAQFILGWLIMF